MIPYFCPVMPWFFVAEKIFVALGTMPCAEFEILNFTMAGRDNLMPYLQRKVFFRAAEYARLLNDKTFYDAAMNMRIVFRIDISLPSNRRKDIIKR